MYFKNGVPIGYVEVLSIIRAVEVGFNLYYTFREGETAWLYARLLTPLPAACWASRAFRVDPYQIGIENDEAIDSGAFWFYRKLGFRPLDRRSGSTGRREEQKMAPQPGHRSSRRTLKKLARSYILFESSGCTPGEWDRFRARALAMAVERLGSTAEANPLRRLLRLIPDLDPKEREALVKAKQGPEEARYLRLLQRNARLRAAILRLGSKP